MIENSFKNCHVQDSQLYINLKMSEPLQGHGANYAECCISM